MATAAEILAQVAPTLADSPLAGGHLALAEMQTGQVFGELRSYAVALLAAHTLAITTRGEADGGAAGAVTFQKEGQLAVSYGGNGVVAAGSSNLSSTSYGLELDRLKRICVMGARSRLVL